MLLSLKIENYALIHSCNVNFYSGFTAITGETGAGKSIMLGALTLVLGGRADTQVLLDKEKKCIIEAEFSISEDMKSIFIDNDLDFEKHTVFRREITPLGKSRGFINDTPVQLSIMKMFADYLVDIHSQSATINLKSRDYQLSIIDSLLDNPSLLASYRDLYKTYRDIEKIIKDLQLKQSQFFKEKSYNEFLFEELESANLQEGEQEENETLLELVTNVETIKENIIRSLQNFDNEQDNNILGLLSDTNCRLNRIVSHNSKLFELNNRVESTIIELKDVYNELSSFNDELDFDENQMIELSDRLNLIYTLQKKHSVHSISELLKIKKVLQIKILQSDNIDSEIDKQIELKNKIVKQLEDMSLQIHELRLEASKILSKEIKPFLQSMAMNDAVLQVEITKEEDFNINGKDKVRFLFNANRTKGNCLRDISNVISGGELSRLMLAIKSVTARKYSVPTLIFDEIDTGTSGDIASKIADIMLSIANNHQVIVITHLVQMAAKADNHYKVFKEIVSEQTQSNICQLDMQQRIEELAKMLSGDTVTKEALANARILLNI